MINKVRDIINDEDKIMISNQFDTSYTLESALTEVNGFLDDHSTEFVILFVKFDCKKPANLGCEL